MQEVVARRWRSAHGRKLGKLSALFADGLGAGDEALEATGNTWAVTAVLAHWPRYNHRSSGSSIVAPLRNDSSSAGNRPG
jgi:hypothetical protein